MTLREVLGATADYLERKGVESARLEAELVRVPGAGSHGIRRGEERMDPKVTEHEPPPSLPRPGRAMGHLSASMTP